MKWFGLIVFVISVLILINDLVIIPNKNKDYLISCYDSTFLLANTEKPIYLREQYYACVETSLTVNNMKKCWKEYSPETYNQFIETASKCSATIYNSDKILF